MSLFPLPKFLAGRITPAQYEKWLECKANSLKIKDQKRKRPYGFTNSIAMYKALINLAVVNSSGFDPYTGEKLAWELIGTWTGGRDAEALDDPALSEKKYALLPTIDHKDPNALDLEIVSWRVNSCKTYLTPKEFIALCRKVARRSSKNNNR